MSRAPTALAAGFADPVLTSQRVFRRLLEAMSNPGRIVTVPPLVPPPGLSVAAAAVLLTLADFETPVWLDAASREAAAWLRFHTGARTVDGLEGAVFAVARADAGLPALSALPLGTDAYPDRGATLVVEVAALAPDGPLVLTGPGIDGRRRLACEGTPPGFWRERAELAPLFPRGVDLVLTCADQLAAVPRTTAVED